MLLEKEILKQLQKGAMSQNYIRGLSALGSSRLSFVGKGQSTFVTRANHKYCNNCVRLMAPSSYMCLSLPIRNGALLQTQTSIHNVYQLCSYHSLLHNGNSRHRYGKDLLTNSSNISAVKCSYYSLLHNGNSRHRYGKDLLTNSSNISAVKCSYYSLLHKGNSRHRYEKDLLTNSSNISAVNTTYRRCLSMAWLENLAVAQSSWFQSLAQSQFVEGVMIGLQVIHDSLHIPWWSSIIVSTIILRGLLTFPLSVYQNYILAKMENLKGELDGLVKELARETAFATKKFGWTKTHARYMFNRSLKKLRKDLIIRENCHPFKASLVLWIQIPLWVGMSLSFRNMASMMPHQDAAAQVLFLQLSTGGISWIPNLTEVDHSFILPVAMGITNLLITEVNALSRPSQSRLQSIFTNMFRVISLVMIPIASNMPSCVVLYWVTSSVCGLVQNLALMHPQLRQACGIPKTPSQNPTPYQHLWLQLQKRFKRNHSQE